MRPRAARLEPVFKTAPLARTGPLVEDADGPTGVAVAGPWAEVGMVPFPLGIGWPDGLPVPEGWT